MEDFSFPSIPQKDLHQNDPINFLPDATSLWFLSPPQTAATHFRRSFSSADGALLSPNNFTRKKKFAPFSPALSDFGTTTIDPKMCIFNNDDFDEEEERMDSLWEQFHNLELFMVGANYEGDKKMSRRRSVGVVLGLDPTVKNEKMAGSIRAMKQVNLGHGRKPSLVEMLGMLKRWFVAHGSSRQSTSSSSSYNSKRKY